MEISAKMVKELRDRTGAGMSDCKKALTETNGNIEEAVEFLRKNGQAKAAKKANRIAAEGVCRIVTNDKFAAVVEVNSETDFVAKNEKFTTFVEQVANQVLNGSATTIEELLAEKWYLDESKTVNDVLVELIAVIGEKLSIRRFEKVESKGCLGTYTHGGGKVCTIINVETDVVNEAVEECAHNLGIQVCVLNPQFISKEDMGEANVAHEKEIIRDSALSDPASLPKPIQQMLFEQAVSKFDEKDAAVYEEKKKDQYLFNFLSEAAKAALVEAANANKDAIFENKIFTGLVEGRLSKQLKEICLADQEYVKAEDGKSSVKQYIDSVAKAAGANLKVAQIVRFETGEGMEKKNEDFAAEVAAQMNA